MGDAKWYRFESEMIEPDTIYAVSSGSGMAGIAVVRMSGSHAGAVLSALSDLLPPARHASVRQLRSPVTKAIIDQALVLWLPGPSTVTGEDVAEFHVHGSAAVIDALFSAFKTFSSVRLAEPGEFTRRAFINGRIDLVEAEGLADLLLAGSEAQHALAMGHMLGRASSIYESWRSKMLEIAAHLEAAIDFADEDGVAEVALQHVRTETTSLIKILEDAVQQSERAGLVRNGIKVVIGGPPNVGKSSLLNAISAREAAIVSSRPGTTRDVIEVRIVLEGVPVILTDTAGLRPDTGDEIENIGMERARSEIVGGDIRIWVTAADVESDMKPPALPDIHVFNKLDLVNEKSIHIRNENQIGISTKTAEGLEPLLQELRRKIGNRAGGQELAVVVRTRHKTAVEESIRYLNESLTHDFGHVELAAECLRKACQSMARITGRVDVEDLLGKIFSEFCIGK